MKRQAIVVGAGPAGSTAAFYLAQGGADVLLVDKETWPRDKICGDGQGIQVHDIYREMGILEEAEEAAFSKLPGWTWSDADENCVTFFDDEPFTYCTPRRIIDDIIRRGAVRGGAEFMENFEAVELIMERGAVKGVKGLYKGKTMDIYSDIVVVAEGAHSMLARQLGIWTEDPELVFYGARAYFDNVNGMINAIEEHFVEPLYPSGYMWVFPMGGKRANVGVFIPETALRKSGLKLEDFFDWWRDNTKIGKERLGEAKLLGEIKGWRLPTSRTLAKNYAPGAVVIGDSANMIECMDGGGFIQAMYSGKITGTYLANALAKGDLSEQMLEGCYEQCKAFIDPYLKFWGTIRDYITYSPDETRKFVAAVINDPAYPNVVWDVCFKNYMTQVLKLDPNEIGMY